MRWIARRRGRVPGQAQGSAPTGRVSFLFYADGFGDVSLVPASAQLDNDPVIMLALPVCTTRVLCVLRRPMIDYCGYVVPTLVDSPSVTWTWNGDKARRHLYQM